MDEESNNFLGFGLFFFLIVLIVLGGSYLIYTNFQNKQKEKIVDENENVIVSDKNKEEKNKDFIYYTNEVVLSESLSLTSKFPVINLNSSDALNATNELKTYVESVNQTLKKQTEQTACVYENEEQIAETNYLDYGIYTYEEYITLLVLESNFNCETGFSASSKVKSYTFNVLTGKKLTTEELLLKYNTTLTQVLERIRQELESMNETTSESESIQVEETLKNLKENETFVIYIDEFGNLVMNYVVKTNSVDYNDNIIINE